MCPVARCQLIHVQVFYACMCAYICTCECVSVSTEMLTLFASSVCILYREIQTFKGLAQ